VDRSDVEAVKARINISDIVRRYVDLKPVSGRWMGACPFHQETKPSMSVNDDEGFFYCFGCQASGDVIDFYGRINGVDFRESLEQLAAEAGIELGNVPHDPHAAERKARKQMLMDMHDEANQWFQRNLALASGDHCRKYLADRGMTPEMIARFGLGYSPEDWHGLDNYLRTRGRDPESGVDAGLLSKNGKGNIYDRFRGRLIFPIQNLSGRVIAFGGRIITDGEPKYLNSSDTPIYKKGDHLYSSRMILLQGVACKVVLMPDGEDVDSLLQTKGAEGFEACMKEAPDGLTFCMNTLRAEYAPRDIMAWAKSFLSELSDGSLRAYYLPRLASGLGLSEADFRRDAGGTPPTRNPQHQPRQAQRAPQQQKPQPAMGVGKDYADDRYFLRFTIQYPDYCPELVGRGLGQVLRTDWARALWEKLATTQHGQITSLLNEHEKGFYFQCREELRDNGLSGRELQDEWNHICSKITFEQDKLDKRQLNEAIRQAYQNGDTERAMQLLALKKSPQEG
jgi:DNA primase